MARKQSPALTDAEAQVMAVLWRLRRASVSDVVNAMNETRPVTYSTVQTILRILETKGYVTHEKVARASSMSRWSMSARRAVVRCAIS